MMNNGTCLGFSPHYNGFECGYWVFSWFAVFYNLFVLCLVFILGFKVLQLNSHFKEIDRFFDQLRRKSVDFANALCSGRDFNCVFGTKILSRNGGFFRLITDSNQSRAENARGQEEFGIMEKEDLSWQKEDMVSSLCRNRNLCNSYEDDDDKEGFEVSDEEEECLSGLKKEIKIERKLRNAAYLELEKERNAAASAAYEAMAMIVRLQNEKSSIELQSREHRSRAEQKELYDQEVIQSLRWIILKQESEMRMLEEQLQLCRKKLGGENSGDNIVEEDEEHRINETRSDLMGGGRFEDDLADQLMSSLEQDSH